MYITRMQERYNLQDIDEVFEKMNEQDSKIMRMLLKKLWIEDFHEQCKEFGDATFECMDKFLRFEADCMTMQFIYNGFLVDEDTCKEEFMPSIG